MGADSGARPLRKGYGTSTLWVEYGSLHGRPVKCWRAIDDCEKAPILCDTDYALNVVAEAVKRRRGGGARRCLGPRHIVLADRSTWLHNNVDETFGLPHCRSLDGEERIENASASSEN